MVNDPVCRMQVEPKKAAGESVYAGRTYYFCSPGCKTAFDKDPEKYLAHPEGQMDRRHGHGHHGHH